MAGKDYRIAQDRGSRDPRDHGRDGRQVGTWEGEELKNFYFSQLILIQSLDLQSLICGVIRSIMPLLRSINNNLSIALHYEVGC